MTSSMDPRMQGITFTPDAQIILSMGREMAPHNSTSTPSASSRLTLSGKIPVSKGIHDLFLTSSPITSKTSRRLEKSQTVETESSQTVTATFMAHPLTLFYQK